ncbi:MAG: MarC family protein [Verrucomicrobiae bacterium]|nr:MarC family protein [Verrucomicrobiae bacterium]
MNEMFSYFISIYIKFFFLLTPFFVLSMFLSLTKEMPLPSRHRTAMRVAMAIIAITFVLYFFGNTIFKIFDITVDSFRVGAGCLLFLSAVALVHDKGAAPSSHREGDLAVVPLAIPIAVGPGTTGALLVMGAEISHTWQKATGCAALLMAALTVGGLLWVGTAIEKWIGRQGILILSKLTGLMISALAARIVFTGVRNLLLNP